MKKLTQERLKELLNYDPETGEFTWLSSRGRVRAGSRTGSPDANGYLVSQVDGEMWKLHRLAFLYMTGTTPEMVDHVNRVAPDNRWANLRAATRWQNGFNQTTHANSGTGVKGVFRMGGRFEARIRCNGKKRYLGSFDTVDDAKEFIELAREMLHGEYACHG